MLNQLKSLFLLSCLLVNVQLLSQGDWQDTEYFMLWDFRNSKQEPHVATLMALTDLKFCRFPSETYTFNNYPEIKKQSLVSSDVPKLLAQAEKLAFFCIADQTQPNNLICGVEIAHLTRINCAYVFKNLPDTERLRVYLVSRAVVQEVLAIENIDQMVDNFDQDWSDLAQALNSDAEPPKPVQQYALVAWLVKLKNYLIQKTIGLILYFVK